MFGRMVPLLHPLPLRLHTVLLGGGVLGGWEKGRDLTVVSSKVRTTKLSPEPRVASLGKPGSPGGRSWMGPLGWMKRKVTRSSLPGTKAKLEPVPARS